MNRTRMLGVGLLTGLALLLITAAPRQSPSYQVHLVPDPLLKPATQQRIRDLIATELIQGSPARTTLAYLKALVPSIHTLTIKKERPGTYRARIFQHRPRTVLTDTKQTMVLTEGGLPLVPPTVYRPMVLDQLAVVQSAEPLATPALPALAQWAGDLDAQTLENYTAVWHRPTLCRFVYKSPDQLPYTIYATADQQIAPALHAIIQELIIIAHNSLRQHKPAVPKPASKPDNAQHWRVDIRFKDHIIVSPEPTKGEWI